MLSRLGFPPVGRHRRFVGAMGIDALGSGVWAPVTMLYFLAVTPLSLTRIGVALSLAAALTLPLALLAGQVVDRVGPKQMMLAGNLLQAVGFAAYPLAHDPLGVFLVVLVSATGRTAFWGSFAPLVVAITEPGEREQWFGFVGALRNAGFAVGGLLAGLAVSIGTGAVYQAVVLLNAVSYVAALALLAGVRTVSPPPAHTLPGGWGVVLRDRGYRWLVAANLPYALGGMVLTYAVPVYLVRMLLLPGWLSGGVFVLNTVLVGLGQGLVVRRMTGHVRARIVALSLLLIAGSSVLLYLASPATRHVSEAAALVVVLAATVVFTFGEMAGGPVLATLASEAPPVHLRGRFQAVYQFSWNAASTLAPGLFGWLLSRGALATWGVATLLAVAGAGCTVPLSRRMPLAAQRVTNRARPVVETAAPGCGDAGRESG